jgi:hypothetical protein
MSVDEPGVAYHLLLEPEDLPVTALALRLLVSDEAHQPALRGITRRVLERLPDPATRHEVFSLALSPEEMKMTHTALHLLLNDSTREDREEREVLHRVLDRLPDEHVMRAIAIP